MSRSVSKTLVIAAIVGKDLRQFSRDRMWIIMTPFTMALMVVIFWILPGQVDETVTIGLYPPELAAALKMLEPEEDENVNIITFEDEQRLATAISGKLDEEDWTIPIGISFPGDYAAALRSGRRPKVTVYVDGSIPTELRRAIMVEVREMAFGIQAALQGKDPIEAFPVTLPEEETVVLGVNGTGRQVPVREKLKTIMAIMILIFEVLALSGLVAIEIQRRTVTALLVTRARIGDLLLAKGITGFILGLTQVLIFLFLTQSFGAQWPLVLSLLILGACMASAVGLLAGAAGKDFMGTMVVSVMLIIPLIIPAFAVLVPGSASIWVRVLPSYGLVEGLLGTVAYGQGWGATAPHLGTALAWNLVLIGTALFVLKHRVVAL